MVECGITSLNIKFQRLRLHNRLQYDLISEANGKADNDCDMFWVTARRIDLNSVIYLTVFFMQI